MSTSTEELNKKQEVSFDIADLFAFLWQKKIRITLTSMLLVFVGAYYVMELPKRYIATSTLLLGDSSDSFALTGVGTISKRSASRMDTHIEFIKSRQFIHTVVESSSFDQEIEFYPLIGIHANRPNIDHTVEVIIEDLQLSQIGETDMLRVSFVSKSPQVASDVVNAIGPAFFDFQNAKSREKAEQASRWLNTQVEQITQSVTDSEMQLQNFLDENQLVDLHSQITLLQSEIAALMQEQFRNDKNIADLRTTIDQATTYAGNSNQLLGIPWILDNKLVANLLDRVFEQEQSLNELSKRYKEKHYKHITATSRLQKINNEIDDLLAKLVVSLTKEFDVLLARKNEFKNKLSEARKKHTDLGRLEIELTRLKRELESNQKVYETFLSRLQETDLLKDLDQQGNYTVVDYAIVPIRPFKPNVPLSLIVITIISTIFSIGVWLVLHLMSDSQTRQRQLVRKLGLSIIAEIPKLKRGKYSKKEMASTQQKQKSYAYSEAIRSLRSELMVRSDKSPIRTLLITNIGHGDKKSDVAIDLAESFGYMEKSILVDSDLRTPNVGQHYGLEQNAIGLSNFISRRASFKEVSYKEANSQLTFIPSGLLPQDPMVYISKPRFGAFLKKLGVIYERVIIETPQVNEFSDALVISRIVDGVILLCDFENTDGAEVVDAVLKLSDAGAPLLGVVFENARNTKSRFLNRKGVGKKRPKNS